ncbi:MAG: hypothetical protein OXG24_12185 [Gammaproteobacteria bacterium]|nr:hypothetical protein [Gammaproteobacteria bacterium]
MLRVSSQSEGFDANLKAITEEDVDAGVPFSSLLRQLTEATIEMRWGDLATFRQEAIETIGRQSTVDALAVASGFNGIVRVADATGIPIDSYEDDVGKKLRSSIGIDDFHYSSKSSRYG